MGRNRKYRKTVKFYSNNKEISKFLKKRGVIHINNFPKKIVVKILILILGISTVLIIMHRSSMNKKLNM